VLFAYACHFCRAVEDRDEVWVEPVGAVCVSALREEDYVGFCAAAAACEGCAETLRAVRRSGCACKCGVCLGGVLPEEAQERVWFRHCWCGLRGRACVEWSGDGGELRTFEMEIRLVTDGGWRPRESAALTELIHQNHETRFGKLADCQRWQK
jgi:hypothetical protein